MSSYFSQASKGLLRNKTRTLLTTLGIVIGIAVVIIVLSAGAGFKSYINAQVDQFGSNTVTIQTQVPPSTRDRNQNQSAKGADPATEAVPITTLSYRDIVDVRTIPNVAGAYGAVLGQKVVSYDQKTKNTFIFGSDADRFKIDKGVVASGRPFSTEENTSLAQVAVLGHDIARDLFGDNNPLGKTIRVGDLNFTVIGVYAPRGSFGFSNDDEQVFIPITTLQKKILGIDYLFYAVVQVVDPTQVSVTALDIEDILRQNHHIYDKAKDDFLVNTQEENLSTFNTILSATTLLLIAIAAISLIVGGVGVMNIMYVAVTERTAEVGLKKALGARNRDILYEFLTETILLTLLGGAIGIIIGSLFSFIIAKVAQSFGFAWAFSVPFSGVVAGFLVALVIGLVFGVLPARNAAKLDPIVALRYE